MLELPLSPCPKHMTYGPCGGVNPDGSCEVEEVGQCVFVEQPLPLWGGSSAAPSALNAAGQAFLSTLYQRPVIISDMPTVPLDADSIRSSSDLLAGHADAVLLGDHGGARVQFPPAYRAVLVQQAGLKAWVGFNCRDRNRVALEAELAALRHANVAGVHCITGDHTQLGHRPDAMPVFDLDSTRLAALAHQMGVLVSVAESPMVIPIANRPLRLRHKRGAGAHLCIVNHSGEPQDVRAFVEAAQSLGANIPFVVGVAVITSQGSAEQVQGFRNLVLPGGYLGGILGSSNPRQAGIRAAVKLGQQYLGIPGVRGLNLSTVSAPGQELELAADLATVGQAFL
jgi:methylenetetrahydrofolate reductase (NADPH)